MVMNAQEINQAVTALNKAAKKNDMEAVEYHLKNLQRNVRPTHELLRATKVGIAVNRLKSPPSSPEVRDLAHEIVMGWRKEINATMAATASAAASKAPAKEGGENGSSKTSSVPPNVQSQGGVTEKALPQGNGGMAPKSSAGAGQSSQFALVNESSYGPPDKLDKSTAPPNKRTWQTDGLKINTTDNELRNRLIRLLYNGLAHTTSVPPRQVLHYAIRLEEAGCMVKGFNTSPKSEYSTKIIDIYHSMKSPSNPELRTEILNGTLDPEAVVKRDSTQLKSSRRIKEDEEHKKRNLEKAMTPKVDHSVSKTLTCGKCGQKQVTYNEVQTRSADEPMTLFCTCLKCGKSWKQ